MRKGNFGSMLIDSVLPEQMRGKARTLDAKGLAALFKEVHEVAPDKYPTILKSLADIGRRVSTESGGFSFGPEDLIEPEHITKLKDVVRQKVHHEIIRNRQDSALGILRELSGTLPKDLYAHQLSIGSPMAKQIASGSRGNPGAMARLMSGDVLYVDHRDREVPYPILRGFAEGLDPAEYFGASFGGRKGVVDTKLSVQNSGALAKVLKQAVHKFIVTKQQDDFEENPDRPRGLPVDTDDNENDGALLAQDVAGFPRNTVINSKVRAAIKAKGIDRILVRSPISGRIAPGGGLYARDVGIRESGDLPGIGDAVGITASDTISEPVGQGTLSSKHAGGAAGSVRKVGGFKALQQIIGVPKTFPGGAAHSETDGNVDSITDHPDGGKVVSISGTEHYVAPGFTINVKPGDTVEAGDPISDGLPNPAKIAEHQGLGEAKRKMVGYLKNTLNDLNVSTERRNLELVAHGLVNHVTVDDELGPYYPGDTVPYDEIEKYWEPRDTARSSDVDDAAGQYLEEPVLHYTVGTKIRPSVRKELKTFGVKNIKVHPEPPPFHASMIRAQDSLRHDPDWMTRFLGTNLEDSLLDATHRGLSSSPASTSFVPAAASGQIENFGPIAGKGILKAKPGSVLNGIGGIGKAADSGVNMPYAIIGNSPAKAWNYSTPQPAPTPAAPPVVKKPVSPVSPAPSRSSVLAGIAKKSMDVGLPAIKIDRPKGFQKKFRTPTGEVVSTYPVDYGYFDGIINPDDQDGADVFLGSGGDTGLHGRFMKGKTLGGKWEPDERKWYANLTPEEHQAVLNFYTDQDPTLLRDHAPFNSISQLVEDLKSLSSANKTAEEDHKHGQHCCSSCGTMVWQCRCITRPGQERKQYHDVDPSECRHCTSKGEKQAAGLTAAGGTGGPVAAGPLTTKPNSILPPPVPKPKPPVVEPKPVPQPKAMSGITEGNSATKPLPGVASNPAISNAVDTVGRKGPAPQVAMDTAPSASMDDIFSGKIRGESSIANASSAQSPSVSPLTSAAVSALGGTVARHAGLPGLAALTDYTGHNGSNIQTLLGDRSANPNAYLYERNLPANVRDIPESTPAQSPAIQAPAPAPTVQAPTQTSAPTQLAGEQKPVPQQASGRIQDQVPPPEQPTFQAGGQPPPIPERQLLTPAEYDDTMAKHRALTVSAIESLRNSGQDTRAQEEELRRIDAQMQARSNPPKAVEDTPIAKTDPRTFSNTPDPEQPITIPANPNQEPPAQDGGPSMVGQIASGVAPMVAGQAAANRFTPKAIGALRKGLVSGGAGVAADAAWRLANGENVTLGDLAEGGATSGLMSAGGGLIAAPAIVDAAKNLIPGAVTQEDIANREAGIEGLNSASTNPNLHPAARAGYGALNLATTAMTPVTSTRAAMKTYDDNEKFKKQTISQNMMSGPAVGAAGAQGVAKAQAAGNTAAEMRARLAAAESDARLSHSTMMSKAPLWSTSGPKGNQWNQLSDQMADLAKARIMVEHGMKEDGTPMSSIERNQMQEAIKQRSAMVQKNQDLLNRGFWGDAFSS